MIPGECLRDCCYVLTDGWLAITYLFVNFLVLTRFAPTLYLGTVAQRRSYPLQRYPTIDSNGFLIFKRSRMPTTSSAWKSAISRARDVAKTQALARSMVAYWAGPRHACQVDERMGEMTLDRVSDEFLALWNALTSPHRVISRHYTVTTVPEGLGYRLRLQPTDKVPGRPTFSRNYRDEVAMRLDANVLTAMLTDADWKANSEELIFEAWQELVTSKSLAEEWLAGRVPGH